MGRGWKWMGQEEGLKRDIEVVRGVRQAVGPNIKIQTDPNDGYREDPQLAWRFLEGTAGAQVHWIEEPFPENVERYTDLKAKIERAGLKTLIAEGESMRQVSDFGPYLTPQRLIDVMQLDMRQGGFLDCLALARLGAPAGALSAPHNWSSQVGKLMGLQFCKAVPNVAGAEDDRSTCDAIVADGYEFRNGLYTLPDTPGLSIRVDEEVYRLKSKPSEVLLT
jgi:D-galactarolactone cycloisomerase